MPMMTRASLASLLLVVLATVTSYVEGFPVGAPNYVCGNMRPLHPGREQVYSPDAFPYNIRLSSYTAAPGDLITGERSSVLSGECVRLEVGVWICQKCGCSGFNYCEVVFKYNKIIHSDSDPSTCHFEAIRTKCYFKI